MLRGTFLIKKTERLVVVIEKQKECGMQRICVYTGSNKGKRPEYLQAAQALGKELAVRGWSLVYGGGHTGLMGAIADTVMAEGGEVIGVMPGAMFPEEVAHKGITKLYEVNSMHERKAMMADLADGFVTMPGGLGTYDELFEMLTWAQLGFHQKPVGLLNVSGYFDPLLSFIHHTMSEGFMHPSHAELLIHKERPADLLDSLAAYVPPALHSKWTDSPVR
jgi:uncharacterized protein (TIGR00730 family)